MSLVSATDRRKSECIVNTGPFVWSAQCNANANDLSEMDFISPRMHLTLCLGVHILKIICLQWAWEARQNSLPFDRMRPNVSGQEHGRSCNCRIFNPHLRKCTPFLLYFSLHGGVMNEDRCNGGPFSQLLSIFLHEQGSKSLDKQPEQARVSAGESPIHMLTPSSPAHVRSAKPPFSISQVTRQQPTLMLSSV